MTSSTTKRVAITGMGIVNGLGNNLSTNWENALAGKSGVTTMPAELALELGTKIAGNVTGFNLSESILPAKESSRYDRFIHFALDATAQAMLDSGLVKGSEYEPVLGLYEPHRMGAILGVGIGGFIEIEKTARTLVEKGPKRVSPFFIPSIIPNMTSGLISIRFNLQGLNYSISSACASSAHAITAASYEIMHGRQDVMVTGGAESVICALGMAGFINMKALSKNNDDPAGASRPFDSGRDGFIMGEGAGILILEDYEKATKRGAKIYAEIVGHGATSDAYHITAPHAEGEGAFRCMKMAVENAGLNPNDIGYINAHGTSTPLGDLGETKAIKRAFGDHAYRLHVSSTKSMTGHLLGAAGGVETIYCALALYSGKIPPTINLTHPDPECDLNYVPNKCIAKPIEFALNNSFGFGGTNASLVLKKAHTIK